MSNNPYEAPSSFQQLGSPYFDGDIDLPPKDRVKAEAVVKDAGQFWLAILLCFFCSALGLILIVPWYGVRLAQWGGLANRFPALLNADARPGSLPYRFQKARMKLILGMVIGGLIFCALFGLLLLMPVLTTR